jgi:hypothetical protein
MAVIRDLETAERDAFARLMRHCDRCEVCGFARDRGLLLDPRALCGAGRGLAEQWDAAEAAIAQTVLARPLQAA